MSSRTVKNDIKSLLRIFKNLQKQRNEDLSEAHYVIIHKDLK